jgi:hypothetical protein
MLKKINIQAGDYSKSSIFIFMAILMTFVIMLKIYLKRIWIRIHCAYLRIQIRKANIFRLCRVTNTALKPRFLELLFLLFACQRLFILFHNSSIKLLLLCLGGDISVILVIPPTETVCSVTDTSMAINLNR